MRMANKNTKSDFVRGTTVLVFDEIERVELEQLRAKVAEFLQEAALAFKRIAKNQEEIERLKAETRAMLEPLRAA
jgi:uncharacterized small protein (DUF1192 family)